MRSTIVNVTFRQGFRLPGIEAEFPAGSYEVFCEDERLEGPTFEAFRRIATFLQIKGQGPHAGLTELQPISQQDLDAALLADRGGTPARGPGGGSL